MEKGLNLPSKHRPSQYKIDYLTLFPLKINELFPLCINFNPLPIRKKMIHLNPFHPSNSFLLCKNFNLFPSL